MVEFDSRFPLRSDVVQKTLLQYDPVELAQDFRRIESLIDERGQLCVNSMRESADPLYENVGKVKSGGEPLCEVLNEPFRGLIFERILRDLGCLQARARIMKLGGRACYSFHWDTTPRYHVPIVTNKNAFLFFDGQMPVHLPADGGVYWLDTRRAHTALNCDSTPRFHFVIVDPTTEALAKGGYR